MDAIPRKNSLNTTFLDLVRLQGTILGLILCLSDPVGASIAVGKADPSGSAARAGIVDGDHIIGWFGQGTTCDGLEPGAFESIVDWWQVETEVIPRGDFGVEVARSDGASTKIAFAPGYAELKMRPVLSRGDDPALATAYTRLLSEDVSPAFIEDFHTTVRELAANHPEPAPLRWWAAMTEAGAWRQLDETERAESTFEYAAQANPADWRSAIHALLGQSRALRDLDRLAEAEAVLVEAQQAIPESCRDSLLEARILDRQGECARRQGDYDRAAQLFSRGLEMRQTWAPESLDTAASFNGMALASYGQGDMEVARQFLEKALEIRLGVDPNGIPVAQSYNNLGLAVYNLGDLEAAQRYLEHALKVKRKLAPDSLTLARSINNLALVATSRGHFLDAEKALLETLAIEQKHAPDSTALASTLNNLGELNLQRGDFGAARAFLERALKIHREVDPESNSTARTYGNLGYLESELDRLNEAEHYHRQALTLFENAQSGGAEVAKVQTNIASLAMQRGDLAEAERLYELSLRNKRKLAPKTLIVVSSLAGLGDLKFIQGDLERALEYYDSAIEIAGKLAPGSLELTGLLASRARIWKARDDPDRALSDFRAAVETLEVQTGVAADTSTARARFRSTTGELFHDLIALLIESGKIDEALSEYERYRARSFEELLRQREIDFPADVPVDLAQRWRVSEVMIDRLREKLAKLSLDDADAIEATSIELASAQHKRDEIGKEIVRHAPQFRTLVSPPATTPERATALLGDGTVALLFSLGDDSGHVFALASDQAVVVTQIDAPADQLRQEVQLFRGLLEGEAELAVVRRAGAALFMRLAGDLQSQIRSARRLIVVPDGPLNLLPFAALAIPNGDETPFIGETHPVTTVASLGALEQLRRGASKATRISAVAYADPPKQPNGSEFEAELPSARLEARAVARIFNGQARIGDTATESQLVDDMAHSNLIHLAVHARLSHHRPLDSSLVLAPDDANDGLLHAWEIIAGPDLDARLVTLSGCSTALGETIPGEGLHGLVRAFQLRGVPAVMASMWQVEDRETADFMAALYRRAAAGVPPSAALQHTQKEWIQAQTEAAESDGTVDRWLSDLRSLFGGQEPRTSRVWAAFQLYGDWRSSPWVLASGELPESPVP